MGTIARRSILACTAMLRWFRVLLCLRGFNFIGPRMIPIMQAMSDTLPFTVVVFFPTLGIVNFYFALGIEGLSDSFMNIFRLAFLGDFELDELEGESNLRSDHPKRLPVYFVVRLLFVMASLMLTITMMNIFIGVLSTTYSIAHDTKAIAA